MYYYTHCSEDAARAGRLWRDATVIREELSELKSALAASAAHMKECEERKDELFLLLTADSTPEILDALSDVVAECEEERDAMRELLERAEALSDELGEALWWLRRTCA